MIVLGVHKGHDSSAALIVNGVIVADVAEERFTRIKHHAGLPFHAVAYCLEVAGIKMEQVDAVAIASRFPVRDFNLMFDLAETDPRAQRLGWKGRVKRTMEDFSGVMEERLPLYLPRFRLGEHTQVINVDHHLAHAAAAFHTCPHQEKQLVLSMDGLGDGFSICIYCGENGRLEPLHQMGADASLGWFYSNITEALGWWHGDGEGKTMGLAPYGDPSPAYLDLTPFHPKFAEGRLSEPHDFGRVGCFADGGTLQWTLREAAEIRKLLDRHSREDLAAAAQRILEEQVMNIAWPWLDAEKTRNLTCSGGVFMNVKLNQRIWESGRVDHHWIYPNAGDSGLAVGAALHIYHAANPGSQHTPFEELYHGPEFTDTEIEALLRARHLAYRRVDDPAAVAAALLADDKIVGWFQGRMESGPRALGNRSILVSANRAENKDLLNARVKFREGFRPFCPSVLWEKKEEYMMHPRDEFFMITSFTCPPEKRERVPAVVHADGTLRPQTIKKEFNPLFHRLLSEFGRLTGEWLILNTSFNVMGEPIVLHPREAIRCFYDNGLDALVIGSFLLEKKTA
jgi:carbamoyltransferase